GAHQGRGEKHAIRNTQYGTRITHDGTIPMTPSEPAPSSRPGGGWARYAAALLDPGTGAVPGNPPTPIVGPDPGPPAPPTTRPCTRWRHWEEYRTAQDERVCPVCGPLHGARYIEGVGPQPPLHPGCRCRRVYAYSECVSRADPSRPSGGGGRPKE